MKNTIYLLLIIILTASCKKEVKETPQEQIDLIGTWKFLNYKYDGGQTIVVEEEEYYQFINNNTARFSNSITYQEFTYNLLNGKLTFFNFQYQSEDEEQILKFIDRNNLTITYKSVNDQSIVETYKRVEINLAQ